MAYVTANFQPNTANMRNSKVVLTGVLDNGTTVTDMPSDTYFGNTQNLNDDSAAVDIKAGILAMAGMITLMETRGLPSDEAALEVIVDYIIHDMRNDDALSLRGYNEGVQQALEAAEVVAPELAASVALFKAPAMAK